MIELSLHLGSFRAYSSMDYSVFSSHYPITKGENMGKKELKITHPKWGEVEGVEEERNGDWWYKWRKNGAIYEPREGWFLVEEGPVYPDKLDWEDVTGEKRREV